MGNTFRDSNNNLYDVIDGDTIADNKGNRMRIKDINAREVDKVVKGEDGRYEFKQGQVGGDTQTNSVSQVIADGGFTEVIRTGEYDDYGRELVYLKNSSGENLNNKLISSGIIEVSPYTSEEAIIAKRERELYEAAFGKDKDPINDLGDEVANEIDKNGLVFKTKAITEAYYDPAIHSGVRYRDPNRTIDNKAKGFSGQVSASWDQGWDGVKEGIWGYLNAIGSVSNAETLENLGEAGVMNARMRMADAPELILDYKEIDDVWDGFSWALNNAVMSAPYLVATFGAAAAAVPAAAIAGPLVGSITAVAPIATIYAGHTWNEMEGEKGIPQFLAATSAGVAAAMVERLGMKALISPANILSSAGINRLITGYAKKEGIGLGEAKSVVLKTAKQEQASLARSLLRMKPSDIAKFSGAGVAKAAALGSLTEAGTEVVQEGIQAATAGLMSDKDYTEDELWNRFINAGLAGGVLGGGFSSAGNVYAQGQNQLMRADLAKNSSDRYRLIEQARIRDSQPSNTTGRKPSTVENNIMEGDINAASDITDHQFNFRNIAQAYENKYRGIKNFFKENDELSDYIDAIATGFGRLVKSAESSAVNFNSLVKSKIGLDIFARIGQVTTGVYHSGMNFKQANDQIISDLKGYVSENDIAKSFGFKNMNSKNAKEISEKLRAFGRDGGFENYELMLLEEKGAYDLATQWKQGGMTDKELNDVIDTLDSIGLRSPLEIRNYLKLINKKGFKNGVVPLSALGSDSMVEATKNYLAAKQIKASYDAAFNQMSQEYNPLHTEGLRYRSDYWWRQQGFDWEKVKKNPSKFKAWLSKADPKADVEAVYQNIVNRGAAGTQGDFSLVNGEPWRPWAFSDKAGDINQASGFKEWSSNNLFETLNKTQVEVAKYASSTHYFGEGGSKLDKLFSDLKKENILTEEEQQRLAWYSKAIIDSSHGNFRRIQSPKWAAINNYLTSWSILAGLPLSTISSIPETMMVYFKVKDNDEWKQATARLIQQVGGAWDENLGKEVEITKRLLENSGLPEDQNTVVNRLATGERDVSFIKVHEAFFRAIGIKQFTQFQRRMNAGFAIDTVKTGLSRLELAPKKDDGSFDLDNFNEVEMRTYLDLGDLGINVDQLYNYYTELEEIYRDELFNITDNRTVDAEGTTDYITSPTQREIASRKLARKENLKGDDLIQRAGDIQSEINEELQTAIYRFVNERIQNPQSANRPLFFQDPHYQLFTQFNGFISTFTANVIPKLWRDQVAKGNPKVKYDTFALILTMMALGGASQYIKDLIKFGQSSPYLDEIGYVQRALYSSGAIGQYERVIDLVSPLYPERGNGLEWLFNTMLGEAGPSARNIETVLTATGQALEGETERAVGNVGRVLPVIGPVTSLRRAGADLSHGKNPLKGVDIPSKDDIVSALLQ